MRPEYDFSGGVRGKYARRYADRTNVVVRDEMNQEHKAVRVAIKRHRNAKRPARAAK